MEVVIDQLDGRQTVKKSDQKSEMALFFAEKV